MSLKACPLNSNEVYTPVLSEPCGIMQIDRGIEVLYRARQLLI